MHHQGLGQVAKVNFWARVLELGPGFCFGVFLGSGPPLHRVLAVEAFVVKQSLVPGESALPLRAATQQPGSGTHTVIDLNTLRLVTTKYHVDCLWGWVQTPTTRR